MKYLETLKKSVAQAHKFTGYEVKFVVAAYDRDFNPVRWYYVAKKRGKGYVSVEFYADDYSVIKNIVKDTNIITEE